MIYYFVIFIKLKHQTKTVATQHAHILLLIKLNFRNIICTHKTFKIHVKSIYTQSEKY